MRGIARQHAAHPDAAPRQAAALTYNDAIRLMATAERPQRKKRRGSPPGAVIGRVPVRGAGAAG